jgi:cellulose synthase/poly-beta-1,6-N-acetylglucosamine synthase-like glycosyltransferase
VNQPLPIVSVIIAAPPDLTEIQAVAAARKLDYPADRLEIIVARGRQPSVQRNAALRAARGEWVYFLDDDALPAAGNLRRVAKLFDVSEVVMVGGPNLCPPDAPALEKVFAVVLASWLAFGPSRARYSPVGAERNSGEKELILCNLLARRAPLMELGGFNEALYPNEENALMDELQQRGRRLVYDPQFSVHRRPRRTLSLFLKMLRTYGRGRAEQFRVHPTPGSVLNFVPPMFCLYLAVLLAAGFAGLPRAWYWILASPLLLYGCAVFGQTVVSMRTAGILRAGLALPLLVASHVFYGLGFWRGLFTSLKSGPDRARTEVAIEILPGTGF